MTLADMKMDEIYATRKLKLRQVMEEQFDGKQSAIAAKLGKQPDYISRIFGGRKQLGEDMAREFEEILGMPPYWFDGITAGAGWPFQSVDLSEVMSLPAGKLRELEAAIRAELRYIAGAGSGAKSNNVA